jgi:hypothetical protein
MKRLTFWVDCRDEEAESTRKRIEEYLKKEGMSYTVLPVSVVSEGRRKGR